MNIKKLMLSLALIFMMIGSAFSFTLKLEKDADKNLVLANFPITKLTINIYDGSGPKANLSLLPKILNPANGKPITIFPSIKPNTLATLSPMKRPMFALGSISTTLPVW